MVQHDDPLFTSSEAAEHLRVSISFLAKARVAGTGPSFIHVGRKVRYSRSALEAFKTAQTRTSTSQHRRASPPAEPTTSGDALPLKKSVAAQTRASKLRSPKACRPTESRADPQTEAFKEAVRGQSFQLCLKAYRSASDARSGRETLLVLPSALSGAAAKLLPSACNHDGYLDEFGSKVRTALKALVKTGLAHAVHASRYALYVEGGPVTDEVNVSAVLNVSERDEHRTKIEGLLRVAGFGQVVRHSHGTAMPNRLSEKLAEQPGGHFHRRRSGCSGTSSRLWIAEGRPTGRSDEYWYRPRN